MFVLVDPMASLPDHILVTLAFLLTLQQKQFLLRAFVLTLPSAWITALPTSLHLSCFLSLCLSLQISAQMLSTREAPNIPN